MSNCDFTVLEPVYDGFFGGNQYKVRDIVRKCKNKAKYNCNGKNYCGIHKNVYIKFIGKHNDGEYPIPTSID